MLKLLALISALFFGTLVIGQQLVCPPNESKFCYEELDASPQIINGAGFNLQKSREFSGTTCNVYQVINTFSLIDLKKDSIVATCQQTIIVQPFEQVVGFPRDTIVAGYSSSEVYNESIFTEGMFPLGANDCNISFTYEDVLVESYPLLYLFRHWEAVNQCTDEVLLHRQRIVMTDLLNNSIATQVEDCAGKEITLDSIEVYHQGSLVDRTFCFRPFTDLHDLLNCMADSLLTDEDDSLSLKLGNLTNPYLGISSQDLVDMQRHILGLKRFESDCRLRAADVNRDGRINGIDLVETRKLILGIYTSWPYGDGPDYYVNDVLKKDLVFKKGDFPLQTLNIVVANQANTSTN